MRRKISIIGHLVSLQDEDQVRLWNEFHFHDGYIINYISSVDDFILEARNNGVDFIDDFFLNKQDKFFIVNEYGRIYSFSDLSDDHCPFDLDQLAKDIFEEIEYGNVQIIENLAHMITKR